MSCPGLLRGEGGAGGKVSLHRVTEAGQLSRLSFVAPPLGLGFRYIADAVQPYRAVIFGHEEAMRAIPTWKPNLSDHAILRRDLAQFGHDTGEPIRHRKMGG